MISLMKAVPIFSLVCFCLLFNKTYGQHDYTLSRLDNTNGLSNNNITGVFQDSDKLLWLNTWDGLKIYNGLSFNSFDSVEPFAANLPSKVVTKVREDASHHIWICTEEGVTRYDKINGIMNHYFYSKGKAKGKSADYLLAINSENDIVCGLRLDTVLYRYNLTKNTMEPIKLLAPGVGKIAKIEFDKYGRLWTLTLGGDLRVFQKTSEGYHLVQLIRNDINIFHVVNGKVFIASNTKLCEINEDFKVRELTTISHTVRDIQYYQGHYFVAWLFKGIQEYDAYWKPVNTMSSLFPLLKSLKINSLTETNGNTLWMATVGKGIIKITERSEAFGLIKDQPLNIVPQSNVQSILKLGPTIWLATLNNGLIKLDSSNGIETGISINPVSSYSEIGNAYYSLAKGQDDNMYVGSEGKGLTVYDPTRRKFTPWNKISGAPFDPDFFGVHAILPQPDSSVFVGYNGGVYHIKLTLDESGLFKAQYVRLLRVDGRFLKPGNNMVSALASYADLILIGYRFAGLSVLNKTTGKIINISNKTLPTNNILTLYTDKSHRIWVGTSYGLFWIAGDDLLKAGGMFKHFSTSNGLPDNNIHALIEDNVGTIWLSSNQGLAKINLHHSQIIQYGVEEGLQNAEFNDNAVFKDEQGLLYFGGISGVNRFEPTKVSTDKSLTNLLITDLKVAGKTADGIQLMIIKPYGSHVTKDFHLSRGENYFSLNVQPSDGYTNRKFHCKYYLKNFDNEWSELSGSTKIEYRGLPPGKYSLYIKWSNGKGQWSPELSIFHMEVKQYLWLTNFAKIMYLIIVICVVYAYYLNRKSRSEIKNRLQLENLMRVKEQKLFDEKMDFFTNITHELQTPLTLILGSLERFFAKKDVNEPKYKGLHFLKIANNEALRLQYLTHQLLEFRRAEAGHLTIQPRSFNVSNLLMNIVELFEPIGERNSLVLSIDIMEDVFVFNDKDKIEKIVFNLLSNAFKYTKQKEKIRFKVATDNTSNTFYITVANSGYAGPTEKLNKLFEQFYSLHKSPDVKISSGIGLAFCKQLTELLGGTINVIAKDNWIDFNVILPLSAPAASVNIPDDVSISDKPSYLVESVISTQNNFESHVKVNNDLALIEDLSNTTRKAILIVEDEPAIRHLLREILKDKYVVYEAENGVMALSLLERIKPNLILSDILMGEMDGLKLCSIIKNKLETCHIPFLLLSALASAEQRVEGFEAGADAYLTKPFSSLALLTKVNQQIQYREAIQNFFRADRYNEPAKETGLLTDDKFFLEKVIAEINANLSNSDLDSTYLENAMALSRMTLYRKIKAFTNMTPNELIKHLRLKNAAYLLRSTHLTVSEIYYQTGFNNQSYFYREFKRIYSYSPKEYRELVTLPFADM